MSPSFTVSVNQVLNRLAPFRDWPGLVNVFVSKLAPVTGCIRAAITVDVMNVDMMVAPFTDMDVLTLDVYADVRDTTSVRAAPPSID